MPKAERSRRSGARAIGSAKQAVLEGCVHVYDDGAGTLQPARMQQCAERSVLRNIGVIVTDEPNELPPHAIAEFGSAANDETVENLARRTAFDERSDARLGDLPQELLESILSRLSAADLLRATLVSGRLAIAAEPTFKSICGIGGWRFPRHPRGQNALTRHYPWRMLYRRV